MAEIGLPSDLNVALRLAIAGLIGFAAGLEREWSGHASGPDARFAGVRTFFLLGALGGLAGHFALVGEGGLALTFALGGVQLSCAGYVMAVHRTGASTDGTTEAAAMLIVALGALAGEGSIGLAAGTGALVVLMLREKAPLQRFIKRIDEPELRAAVQFAALAVVVLPLLPVGPYLGFADVRPRMLWAIVLLFAGLGFAGFLARRIIGASRGLGVAGALGGVISSTAVTFAFTRQSRRDGDVGAPLAQGVIAACVVLVPRVLITSAVLSPAVAVALAQLLLPPVLIGLSFVVRGLKEPPGDAGPLEDDGNPLRLAGAIRMTVAFQLSMIAISLVRARWRVREYGPETLNRNTRRTRTISQTRHAGPWWISDREPAGAPYRMTILRIHEPLRIIHAPSVAA